MKCMREGCDNEVPQDQSRRIYCSVFCYRRAARDRTAARREKYKKSNRKETRLCLKCNKPFKSDHEFNKVCSKCKRLKVFSESGPKVARMFEEHDNILHDKIW